MPIATAAHYFPTETNILIPPPSATQFNHHKTYITNYNTSDTNSTVRRFKNARVAGGEVDDYWRFECK